MPKVGEKEFDYTPEGIAAAEAAAAEEPSADVMLDELVSDLPQEGDDLAIEVPPEPEEELEQSEEVQMPDDEVLAALFETVYGEALDESEGSQEQLQDLVELLEAMPELASAIAVGEISPSEAAILIFREAADLEG